MPRIFDHEDEKDKIIYDEEEEVVEMYIVLEGNIEVCFSLISNGMREKFTFGRGLKGKSIICDNYVVNHQKSQFIYMATKTCQCYALGSVFLHEQVFPKYPDILARLQVETQNYYNKTILKPISEIRKHEIEKMNIKSFYRSIQFTDLKESNESE